MQASQTTLTTLTAQQLFDIFPQITLINQTTPTKTTLRQLYGHFQATVKPLQDHPKTSLRQLKLIKPIQLIQQIRQFQYFTLPQKIKQF